MFRRVMRLGPFAALSLLTLVLAHNLVFVVGYGPAYGEMLSRTGHGDAWAMAVLVVLGLGFALALAATVRIGALWREARRLGRAAHGRDPWPVVAQPSFLPGLLSLWLRLAVSGAVLFALQENLERVGAGADLPGIRVLLSSTHVDPIVLIAAVAGAVAFVGQLFRWHRAVLVARLAAARLRLPRSVSTPRRPLQLDLGAPSSILGRRLAVRAPPLA